MKDDGTAAKKIPHGELDQFADLVRSHPEYLATAYIREIYASLGLQVLPDPFASDVSDLVIRALRTERPFSVIRLGDAEMNILASDAYPNIPKLSDANFRAAMRNQEDFFEPDELWKLLLREMLMSSIVQADVVGVRGLWQSPGKLLDLEKFIGRMKHSPRGPCGVWQSVDYLPGLARRGLFKDKVVASAHLYLGVLQSLDRIVPHARRVLLLTNHDGVVGKIRKKYPGLSIGHIPVGRTKGHEASPLDRPDFLRNVAGDLPTEMRGCFCLVGAGIWAEIYCTWIKQRGGVAVDIGSGFNLLNGAALRPVHRQLGLDRDNPFALE